MVKLKNSKSNHHKPETAMEEKEKEGRGAEGRKDRQRNGYKVLAHTIMELSQSATHKLETQERQHRIQDLRPRNTLGKRRSTSLRQRGPPSLLHTCALFRSTMTANAHLHW